MKKIIFATIVAASFTENANAGLSDIIDGIAGAVEKIGSSESFQNFASSETGKALGSMGKQIGKSVMNHVQTKIFGSATEWINKATQEVTQLNNTIEMQKNYITQEANYANAQSRGTYQQALSNYNAAQQELQAIYSAVSQLMQEVQYNLRTGQPVTLIDIKQYVYPLQLDQRIQSVMSKIQQAINESNIAREESQKPPEPAAQQGENKVAQDVQNLSVIARVLNGEMSIDAAMASHINSQAPVIQQNVDMYAEQYATQIQTGMNTMGNSMMNGMGSMNNSITTYGQQVGGGMNTMGNNMTGYGQQMQTATTNMQNTSATMQQQIGAANMYVNPSMTHVQPTTNGYGQQMQTGMNNMQGMMAR